MIKVHTTLSIDNEILEKAKARRFNISEILSDALKLKLKPSIKDAPEKKLLLKCDNCGSIVEFGFLCEESRRVFCDECEKATEPTELGPRIKYSCKFKESHTHLRIPGSNGENGEIFKKVSEEQTKEIKEN